MADFRDQGIDPAIKGASTAAVATDLALVVALSPNSPMPVGAPAATYSAGINGLALALLATDIFVIGGSATKTVRITKLILSAVQTTASQVSVLVTKHSTANTVGTSTAPTKVPYDSLNAAATATVLAYTANPTVGTTVGTILVDRVFIPGAATATDAQGMMALFGDNNGQTLVLRGVAEQIAINLNGVTVASGLANINVEWTES